MKSLILRTGIAAALVFPFSAFPAEPNDVTELKLMIEQMQQEYEVRIGALETRIRDAEQKAEVAESQAAQTAVEVKKTSAKRRSDSAFNPAISLVVQGSATSYSRDPDDWTLPGFQLGGEAGLKPEGLSLTETELSASANVDSWFFAQTTIGLHEEEGSTEVDLEEAFVDTLSLPAGLGLRIGRFYTETGYLNTKHTHAWDFADAPLTSQAFLGQQYRDDGLRLSLLAPTDTYLELGMEALRGERFPAGGDGSEFLGGAQNYFARLGSDVGASNSFRVGLSQLRTDPKDRQSGHAHDGQVDETFSFAGDSNLTALDIIWKWAPNGDTRNRNFVFQMEYFHRGEEGAVTFSNDTGEALLPYDGTQQGFYAQGVYQFIPRWRAGLRYDKLWSDNNLRVTGNSSDEADGDVLEESGLLAEHDPWRWTIMADYAHSEFSRLRLQYSRDHSRPGDADDQFQLQYIMTLGAHGAHKY
ncbi:MAG: TonB-dependent receptor [Pseudomonadota bacterium]